MVVSLMRICLLICVAPCASAFAQTPLPPTGPIESAIAIEDPNARIAALQKFLKLNTVPEQAQTAREAIVASWAQLADLQLAENNIERAVEYFRRALAALPEKITDRFFDETVIRIPLAASVRGYRNEAAGLARQLEKRFAKEPLRLASLGEFYMTIEASADAIHALETAAKLAEEDARLHRLLGAAYRMGLRLDDAIAEYQFAVNFDANDKRAFYELANLYRAHGAYEDAIKLYRKQLEIEPKHTPSYKGLALAYLAQGDEEQAAAALNQARDLRGSAEEITGDIHLQTQLAFHYLAQNKIKQARQAAEAALLVEPRYSWARIGAAEVDLAEGKYFDAERNLIAARSYAGFPTLFFTLGKLYLAVEDFDGALEQFAKAFSYSPQKQFMAKLGGVLDVQADNLKELLAREHQASIFLAEPPTRDETFKIAEALVRFNAYLRVIRTPLTVTPAIRQSRGEKGASKNPAPADAQTERRLMEELDRAAIDFIEVESSRRSFRMLHIAERLAQTGVATGLAVEIADQALGLAEVATEADGSLRDYPNYDRNGRLAIFRGRALGAKGWALFKANKNVEAGATLTEATQAYGSLPEGRRALWRLATVKETEGELKEALDLYVAGYEAPTAGSEIDVNRAVIESLYRKINGSLDGLNERLGIGAAASVAQVGAAEPATRPNAKDLLAKAEPKAAAPGARKSSQPKLPDTPAPSPAPLTTDRDNSSVTTPAETKPAEEPSPQPVAAAAPNQPVETKPVELPPSQTDATAPLNQPSETKPAELPPPQSIATAPLNQPPETKPAETRGFRARLARSTVLNEPLETKRAETPVEPAPEAATNNAPAAPKPVELPALDNIELSIPLPSMIDYYTHVSTLTIFGSFTIRPALREEPPPPAPAPKAHTRKRRVTVPDDQPPNS
ncbi:MAG: tetratricopeptide repeat protein [Acidobacteria bacterium]|nr:tetratricopeptide repeat protein [Acidobacteriota bacterium]